MNQSEPTSPYYSFNTGPFLFLASIHVIALLAFIPSFFSWTAFALFIFLHWLTCSIGICLGYHRFLTHRGFDLPKWLAYTVVFIGALACQNGPIKWVAQHRMHHAGSDTDDDPHNAAKGFWWSHFTWMCYEHKTFDDPKIIEQYAKDLVDDPFYNFLDKYFIAIQFAFGFVLLAIGGWSFVVWGIFARLVLAYHGTWFVNSASHMFGYKNFKLEKDLSTNCWWVGLLAYGEGWHNNHHAFPKSAKHGLLPWEIDMTWMAISFLRMLGLAKNIKVAEIIDPKTEAEIAEEVMEESFLTATIVRQAV
jgi:sn-1 stearoyl-lipid 9-desaturase